MAEEHTILEMEYDRELLEDVFDSPDLRYVALYMFILRKELFQDLLDDDLMEEFDTIYQVDEPTAGDLRRICSPELIKSLFQFHIITNVKNYKIFQMKGDHIKIRLAKGLKLAHEELSASEEEVHIFFQEILLERVIVPDINEMTQVRIHAALERLRAMMCPKTSVIHELVHKYGDYYVIDDDFYYIIEELGNPYQALRIEIMIRAMSEKYKEIETSLDEYLSVFDKELYKATMMKKFRKAKDLKKTDYLTYLKEKSRKKSLASKFRVEFPEDEVPEIFTEWKDLFNSLVGLKLTFGEIDLKMDTLRAYYSGKKQTMPYMTFITKTTYDEDDISEKIKTLLIDARNALKQINITMNAYSKKDLKILNLDLERFIIDEGLDDEDD